MGGSGKAEGFAQALPMVERQDHRQAPKTPLAAATHPDSYPVLNQAGFARSGRS